MNSKNIKPFKHTNPWNPSSSFMGHKMAISSPTPVFSGLNQTFNYVFGGYSIQSLVNLDP